MLINFEWVIEEIKEEIKKIPGDKWKWRQNDTKSMEHSKSSSKRKVYGDTTLPQETGKISNEQSNLTPKGTRKGGTNKTQN